MDYSSYVTVESEVSPGVVYVLAKMSFGRRIELTKRIRQLAQRAEFLDAGTDAREVTEARVLAAEIERTYALWGLREIQGLLVDGEPATPESLIDSGPEDLFREAVEAVKAECGLSEAERKN